MTEGTGFEDLCIDAAIIRGLRDLGYEQPLPVQLACLEPIRQGRHVSVRSKTGSGKTAGFGIPILEKLDTKASGPELLVLAPTRELAAQIGKELAAIGRHCKIRVVMVYGGASINNQIKAIKAGAHVVVGTPGRLLDLIRRKVLKPMHFKTVVLDEADEMLSMGFYEDVTKLMDACENCRQVIILSASLSEDTGRLIDRYTTDILRIDLSADRLSVSGIDNVFYTIGDELPRHHYLLHVLAVEKPESAIVFVNTRSDASLVATLMAREGLKAEMISGELPQTERERVMAAIRSGELRYLVATDLASRGIDISDLSHVINYSLPEDPTIFLHRVGRTGRVDKKGTSISMVSGRRLRTLGVLERQFDIQFEERKFPPVEQMIKGRTDAQLESLIQAADAAICDGYLVPARAVLEHQQAVQIIAYLLKRHADQVHDEQRTAANRPQQRPRRGRPRSDRKGGSKRKPKRRR
jgi:ATP-dependent RNA helicase DeaD